MKCNILINNQIAIIHSFFIIIIWSWSQRFIKTNERIEVAIKEFNKDKFSFKWIIITYFNLVSSILYQWINKENSIIKSWELYLKKLF